MTAKLHAGIPAESHHFKFQNEIAKFTFRAKPAVAALAGLADDHSVLDFELAAAPRLKSMQVPAIEQSSPTLGLRGKHEQRDSRN